MYMLGCNYFWMLCEGIYLHTLIVVAVFAEEQHLHWYYLLGWGESSASDQNSVTCIVFCCDSFIDLHFYVRIGPSLKTLQALQEDGTQSSSHNLLITTQSSYSTSARTC